LTDKADNLEILYMEELDAVVRLVEDGEVPDLETCRRLLYTIEWRTQMQSENYINWRMEQNKTGRVRKLATSWLDTKHEASVALAGREVLDALEEPTREGRAAQSGRRPRR